MLFPEGRIAEYFLVYLEYFQMRGIESSNKLWGKIVPHQCRQKFTDKCYSQLIHHCSPTRPKAVNIRKIIRALKATLWKDVSAVGKQNSLGTPKHIEIITCFFIGSGRQGKCAARKNEWDLPGARRCRSFAVWTVDWFRNWKWSKL